VAVNACKKFERAERGAVLRRSAASKVIVDVRRVSLASGSARVRFRAVAVRPPPSRPPRFILMTPGFAGARSPARAIWAIWAMPVDEGRRSDRVEAATTLRR